MDWSGVHNGRDLGGLRATDGSALKPGRLYRSGVMSRTAAERIGAGISIFDLRSAKEQQGDVFDWVDRGHSEAGAFQTEKRTFDRFSQSAQQSEQAMTAVYATLAFDLAPRLRSIVDAIIENERPVLFHCLAGKDRTGTIAAILLTMIGIEQEEILADYLHTNRTLDATRRYIMAHDPDAILISAAPEIWSPMAEARAVYLQAMFASLESVGGVQGFAEKHLAMDTVAIERLRTSLLT